MWRSWVHRRFERTGRETATSIASVARIRKTLSVFRSPEMIWGQIARRSASRRHGIGKDFLLSSVKSDSPIVERESGPRMETFESRISKRREEASRSLIVQVKSKHSVEELYLHCQSRIGSVKKMLFFSEKSNFYLVEFDKESDVENAIYSGKMVKLFNYSRKDVDSFIPVRSPFVWFHGGNPHETTKTDKRASVIPNYVPAVFPETRLPIKDIPSNLANLNSLDSQIYEYHRLTDMVDLSSRIRFLACRQLELSLRGIFGSFVSVLPFGSSVNSFGSWDSDLDMVLDFSDHLEEVENTSTDRLFFHVKGGFGHRSMSQMYIRVLIGFLQDLLPGCRNVQNISNARVPILKYHQQLLNLDCDLSATATSGVYMSELLYLFGELDPRVRPLVLVIRRWAKEHGLITNSRPTKLFTNFTLTFLTIFFFQYRQKILPPIDRLREFADPSDLKISLDGARRDFLTDLTGLQTHLNPQFSKTDGIPNLEELLKDFFKFYGDFDFKKGSLCVNSGDIKGAKKDTLSLINPLEPHLNVSANVSPNSISSFQLYCKRTLALINVDPSFESLFKGRVSRNLNDLFQTDSNNSKKKVLKK